MSEPVAWVMCEGRGCAGAAKGETVAVKLNRSGLAYYRCDYCGREVRHHWQRTSDAFVGAQSTPAPAPVAAKPAAKPAAPAPAAPKPIKVDSMSTLLG
jgi:hypothetical protein